MALKLMNSPKSISCSPKNRNFHSTYRHAAAQKTRALLCRTRLLQKRTLESVSHPLVTKKNTSRDWHIYYIPTYIGVVSRVNYIPHIERLGIKKGLLSHSPDFRWIGKDLVA